MKLIRIVMGVALTACSTLGDVGAMPDEFPHGGTGAFRLLDQEEVGIVSPLPGRALITRDAVGSAMTAGDFLFYTTASLLDEPPMLPDDQPAGDIFWPAFEPRRIHRGLLRDEGFGGYAVGPEILSASEPWEGEEVFDPWVVETEDGTARLYYAAAGGIGVAEASNLDGTFSRASLEPIVTDAVSGAPRRPSVVRGTDDAWWMYYDANGEVRAARSQDGLSFVAMGAIQITGPDDGAGRELRLESPGAVRVETTAERTLVRLYVDSVRADVLEEGALAHQLYVLGSDDSMRFTRHPLPVFEDQTDTRFAAPRLLDTRATLLYLSLPFFGGPFLTRAVAVSVAPGGVSFLPESDEPGSMM